MKAKIIRAIQHNPQSIYELAQILEKDQGYIQREVKFLEGLGVLEIEIETETVNCLDNGQVQHETERSGEIDKKNLLVTAQVSLDDVRELISCTKGTPHEVSPHHADRFIEVHTLKPTKK